MLLGFIKITAITKFLGSYSCICLCWFRWNWTYFIFWIFHKKHIVVIWCMWGKKMFRKYDHEKCKNFLIKNSNPNKAPMRNGWKKHASQKTTSFLFKFLLGLWILSFVGLYWIIKINLIFLSLSKYLWLLLLRAQVHHN